MRITKSARSKLEGIFSKKMALLAFDDDRPVSTWSAYLETVGCRRVHYKGVRKSPRGFVLLNDPIWHGDQILVPRDTALKILVMGLP